MVVDSEAVGSWLADELAAGPVTVGRPLSGATTATVWPLEVSGRSFVAKVYDLDIEFVGADNVRDDAAAMAAAEEVGVAAPRLVAADPDGDRLGVPALLMTRLAGAPRAHGRPDRDAWVDGLADALIAIASAPAPTVPLRQRRRWYARPIEPPTWATDPGPWRELDAALGKPPTVGPDRFIHRDFHQLNVLWDGEQPTGCVDWANGCVGPVESDLACGRLNIALAEDDQDGFALADRFLDRCRDAGLPWHPFWDLEWIASAFYAEEAFLAGTDLGAVMSIDGVRRVFESGLVRGLTALEGWSG